MDEQNKIPENESEIKEEIAEEAAEPSPEEVVSDSPSTPKAKAPIPKLPIILGAAAAGVAAVGISLAIILGGGNADNPQSPDGGNGGIVEDGDVEGGDVEDGDVEDGESGGEESHTHAFGDWIVTKVATCKDEGEETRSCDCGETESRKIDKTNSHIEVIDPAVAATCKNTGLTEGKHCSFCGEILIEQAIVPTISHIYDDAYDDECNACLHKRIAMEKDITSQSLNKVDDNLSATFSNATTVFDFVSDIFAPQDSIWVLSTDIYGMSTIATKKAPLNEGNNTFYIHVTYSDQTVSTYTVNIYRNHMYTVSFDTLGGTPVSAQHVEEGCLATEPTTSRVGYAFNSWNYDFAIPVTSSITVTAQWDAHTDTKYIVEYYLQNIEDDNYPQTPELVLTLSGTTDTIAYAEQKTFEHFTIDIQNSTFGANIDGDGSCVLCVCYTRNKYTVSLNVEGNGSVSGEGIYKYGENVTLNAIPHLGYAFVAWNEGEDKVCDTSTFSILINGDSNYTVQFGQREEMSNFYFGSTNDFCSITGVKDTAVVEIVVPDYVTDIAAGSFSGCSNLEKITLPFCSVTINRNIGQWSGYDKYPIGYFFGTEVYAGSYAAEQKSNRNYWISEDTSGIKTYYLPKSLKEITVLGGQISGFEFDNIKIEKLKIGEHVSVSMFVGGYFDCLQEIIVSTNNKRYKSINGNLYSNDEEALFLYATGKEANSFEIPDSVTTISFNAFYGCTSLTSIVIPDSVTTILDEAFSGCSSLTDVYYTGTEAEWAAISIGSYNSDLTGATIHYNYIPGE